MEIMEKALQLAEDLGVRIIQLAGYDVYYEEGNEQTKKLFSENLKKKPLKWLLKKVFYWDLKQWKPNL